MSNEVTMQLDYENDEWITLNNSDVTVLAEMYDSGNVVLTVAHDTELGVDERYMYLRADEILALRDFLNKAYDRT